VSSQETQSSGVQELIDRLREEGVTKGQEEADGLMAAARQKAVGILDDAQTAAEKIIAGAEREAERKCKSGEEALRLAARDAVLKLQEAIGDDFMRKVRKLVSHTLGDQEFLQRLILEITRKAMPDETAGPVEVLLPDNVVTLEELREKPEQAVEGTLSHFVLGLAGDVIREGLSFDVSDDDVPGVRIRLVEEEVEIELTDETISALLMDHLVPRFRAIMERKSE
jgi:V/A-type H+-transporting ATPase subunit E